MSTIEQGSPSHEWYALDASGHIVMPGAASSTATTAGSSGGGYGG